MRVLIFHGYLLRGTGSNVYNAALEEGVAAGTGDLEDNGHLDVRQPLRRRISSGVR